MAEWAALEMRYTRKGIEGSNPSPTALRIKSDLLGSNPTPFAQRIFIEIKSP